jgi:hypothetical protein
MIGGRQQSPERPRITRWVAVGLAMLAVLATWPIWQAALTGRGGRGSRSRGILAPSLRVTRAR